MNFFKSKNIFNTELQAYDANLQKIARLLRSQSKDDDDIFCDFNFDLIETSDFYTSGFSFPKRLRIEALEITILKNEINILEQEISTLQGNKKNKQGFEFVVKECGSFFENIKSLFSKSSRQSDEKELNKRLYELKAQWRATLKKLQSKLNKNRIHLLKLRNLYNLLLDKRESLRRVIKNIIVSSIDDEDDYLIVFDVFTHIKKRLNNSFKKFTYETRYFRCYTAYT